MRGLVNCRVAKTVKKVQGQCVIEDNSRGFSVGTGGLHL